MVQARAARAGPRCRSASGSRPARASSTFRRSMMNALVPAKGAASRFIEPFKGAQLRCRIVNGRGKNNKPTSSWIAPIIARVTGNAAGAAAGHGAACQAGYSGVRWPAIRPCPRGAGRAASPSSRPATSRRRVDRRRSPAAGRRTVARLGSLQAAGRVHKATFDTEGSSDQDIVPTISPPPG